MAVLAERREDADEDPGGDLRRGCWSGAPGLLAFAARVDRSTPAADPPAADGIVALTGGSGERIAAGAAACWRPARPSGMLISGVSRHVTRGELQTITGAAKPLFDCCVDLGFQAANTLGNARETADWARAQGLSHADPGHRRLPHAARRGWS